MGGGGYCNRIITFSRLCVFLFQNSAVNLEWNGYQNKNQHRKLTLEKKILLPSARTSATF